MTAGDGSIHEVRVLLSTTCTISRVVRIKLKLKLKLTAGVPSCFGMGETTQLPILL